MIKYTSVTEYINSFALEVQTALKEIQQTIQKTFPEAKEMISYQMLAFKLDDEAIAHFAAWKKHIGFYGVSTEIQNALKDELEKHATIGEKGTIQFPLDKPMPLDLIKTIVQLRVEENSKK